MIKKIAVSELAVGMYVHEVCGSWVDQPLWKQGFKVQHSADLEKLRQSAVSEVLIDTDRGLDLLAAVTSTPEPTPAPERPLIHASMDIEVGRALKICSRAKDTVTRMFNDARMGNAISSEATAELVGDITDSVLRHPHALISLSRLKISDEYTYMHSVAVCGLMVALARQLDLPDDWVREAGVAGLLHDIGKMAIDLQILNKPGKLTAGEYDIIKRHPEDGLKILRASQVTNVAAIDVCLHHHEKFDGSGYPFGLAGNEISIFSRMAAICDIYDAITSERPYKKAWGPAHSIREMASWKGHFDERIFQAFVRTVGIYPIGALVRLQSDRIGIVIEQNDTSLLKPKILLLVSARTRLPLARVTLDLAQTAQEDKIIRVETEADWGLGNLDSLWTGLGERQGSLFG